MVDLGRAVTVRGLNINSVVETAGVLEGYTVDTMDISEVGFRQFREPLALRDGHALGPIWKGGRTISLTGTIYGATRGRALAKWNALDALCYPTAGYIADPTTFGFEPVYFYEVLSPLVQRYIYARSNGLRVEWDRRWFGGNDSTPLAIPYALSFVAKDPLIYSV